MISVLESSSLCFDHPGVVFTTRLDRSLLRFVVHVNDPETSGVAVTPLEVVEQRPDEVSMELHAFFHCFSDSAKVTTQVLDTQWIIDLSVGCNRRVIEGRPVLSDVKRHVSVTLSHPEEQSRQRRWVDFPSRFGVNAFLLEYAARTDWNSLRIMTSNTPCVVI